MVNPVYIVSTPLAPAHPLSKEELQSNLNTDKTTIVFCDDIKTTRVFNVPYWICIPLEKLHYNHDCNTIKLKSFHLKYSLLIERIVEPEFTWVNWNSSWKNIPMRTNATLSDEKENSWGVKTTTTTKKNHSSKKVLTHNIQTVFLRLPWTAIAVKCNA